MLFHVAVGCGQTHNSLKFIAKLYLLAYQPCVQICEVRFTIPFSSTYDIESHSQDRPTAYTGLLTNHSLSIEPLSNTDL